MIILTSADVIDATDGECNYSWQASGVSIDSRDVKRGDLFIAIVGDNNDGHKYINMARKNGAVAAIVSYIPEDVSQDFPLVIVNDTFEALWNLAKYSRQRMHGKVIMVTGSVGKTSTKEMLACALAGQGIVHHTMGNLNNHYGLPLTLARMPKETDYAVIEVGMSSMGEISPLSVLTNPDVAIITNVEPVHLEFFNSVDEIAVAKAEIFDGLKETGTAIINRDNKYCKNLTDMAREKAVNKILYFGSDKDADARLLDYKDNIFNADIAANIQDLKINYTLGINGGHQAINSLAVLAAINAVGANLNMATCSLESYKGKNGRGKKYNIHGKFGGEIGHVTLIDETYNSSPAAVAACVKSASDIKLALGGRLLVVLGDMKELGKDEKKIHEDLEQILLDNKVDYVFAVGSLMKNLFDKLPLINRGLWKQRSEDLCEELYVSLKNKDIVLIKGSRSVSMEKIVNFILEKEKKYDVI